MLSFTANIFVLQRGNIKEMKERKGSFSGNNYVSNNILHLPELFVMANLCSLPLHVHSFKHCNIVYWSSISHYVGHHLHQVHILHVYVYLLHT